MWLLPLLANREKGSDVIWKMADDVVLSFNDSLVRQSDVKLLDGPYWLNDILIGFCFE